MVSKVIWLTIKFLKVKFYKVEGGYGSVLHGFVTERSLFIKVWILQCIKSVG